MNIKYLVIIAVLLLLCLPVGRLLLATVFRTLYFITLGAPLVSLVAIGILIYMGVTGKFKRSK